MYEIQKDQSVPVKFFAGEYPVVTAVKAVARCKSRRKRSRERHKHPGEVRV